MSDAWELAKLEIQGFRGAKDSLLIEWAHGLNVVSGSNGAGKTTLCHAIEWCLFGKIPALAGSDEFQSEDAIYNRLAPDNGSSQVRLSLRRRGENMVLRRTRRRGSSSTRGTSTLTCELGGVTSTGRDAESAIQAVLGLASTEFSSSVYLRQDTIAELVTGDEDLRNAAIDDLVGLGKTRELLENLQLASVDRAAKQVNEEITSQKENVISAAVMRRGQLARRRESLAGRGFAESDMTIAGGWRALQDIGVQQAGLGTEFNLAFPAPELERGRVGDLQRVSDALTARTQQLEVKSNESEVELRGRAGRLDLLLERYLNAAARMAEVEMEEPAEQKSLLDVITSRLSAADNDLQKAIQVRRVVNASLQNLEEIEPLVADARSRVAQLEANDLPHLREDLATEFETVRRALERESAISRLLALARDYLEQHPQNTCPVCQQRIEPELVRTDLAGLASSGTSASSTLNQRLMDLQSRMNTTDEMLSELSQRRTSVEHQEERRNEIITALSAAGLAVIAGTVDEIRTFAEGIREQVSTAEAQRNEVEQQQSKLRTQIATAEGAQTELAASLGAVASILSSETLPADIPATIDSATLRLNAEMNQLAETRNGIRRSATSLIAMREVITYLRDVEEVTELDRQVPTVRRRMRQLEAAQTRVADLRRSTLEIYNALTAAQDEVLSGNLADLIPTVQEFFDQLGSHPEFQQIAIEPTTDTKKGTTHYSLRAQTSSHEENTFVRTTFSRAELNAVALALFLAVAQTGKHSLAATILDDPSQSLDPQRQAALAEVLQQLADSRQIIVTTEDPALIARLTAAGNATLIELVHQPFVGTAALPRPQ